MLLLRAARVDSARGGAGGAGIVRDRVSVEEPADEMAEGDLGHAQPSVAVATNCRVLGESAVIPESKESKADDALDNTRSPGVKANRL